MIKKYIFSIILLYFLDLGLAQNQYAVRVTSAPPLRLFRARPRVLLHWTLERPHIHTHLKVDYEEFSPYLQEANTPIRDPRVPLNRKAYSVRWCKALLFQFHSLHISFIYINYYIKLQKAKGKAQRRKVYSVRFKGKTALSSLYTLALKPYTLPYTLAPLDARVV